MPVWVALLAVALTSTSLWGGFAGDDYVMRASLGHAPGMSGVHRSPFDAFGFGRGTRGGLPAYIEEGFVPWWTVENARIAFWRPLASVTHWVDYLLYPDCPALMHLHSLAWFGVTVWLAALVFRRIMPGGEAWVAGLAALLYAVDDAHGFPVGWISNRNGVMTAAFGFALIYMYDRWRRDGWGPGLWLSLGCLAAGLGCSEGIFAAVGYLVGYELFLCPGKGKGLVRLLPYVMLAMPWLLFYQAMGYGTTGSGQYSDPLREPFLFATGAIQRLPVLLLSQLGAPPCMFWPYYPPGWAWVHVGFGVVCLLGAGWVLYPLLRRDRVARFWGAGMLLSTLPYCAAYPNERLLFFTGLGAMGLVAQALAGLWRADVWTERRRRGLRVLSAAWVVIHGVIAPVSLPVMTLSPLILDWIVARASDSLPQGPEVAGQDIVAVNAPGDYLSFYVQFRRLGRGEVNPHRLWMLAAGSDAATVTRVDERTLLFNRPAGFFANGVNQIFRGPGYPMHAGYQTKTSAFTAEVMAVTADGRPTEVRFQFAKPLGDPSWVFVYWTREGYAPFPMPEAGQTMVLPGAPWYETLIPRPPEKPDRDAPARS